VKTILKYSLLALALSLMAAPNARAHEDPVKPRPTPEPKTAPEVDPSLAISGLALLAGSLSVAHARRSKRVAGN
jgi:LPXTG-motif cell wall-anchored protein